MKALFFGLVLFPSLLFAQAQVFPTRLTLTEENPSSYLNLRNSGSTPQKFTIELTQFQMNPDGTMKRVKKPDPVLLDLLKYSPKTIEVPPGEKQVVRIMNTSFDHLKDGEYYVHLHFLPDSPVPEKKTAKTGARTMSLQAKIAVAVPVVIRKGTARLEGKLTNPKAVLLKNGDLQVSFKLSNSTPYFLTGDLEIIGVTEKGETSLAKIIGVSSYIPERISTTRFSAAEIKDVLKGGEVLKKIKVHYVANADAGAVFDLTGETEVAKAGAGSGAKKSSKPR